jgi:hypothetical protein
MSLVKELQQLVQNGITVSGRVISVSEAKAVVATAYGQMEVSANGDLQPGNQVTIEAGMATKKQRGGEVPLYFV